MFCNNYDLNSFGVKFRNGYHDCYVLMCITSSFKDVYDIIFTFYAVLHTLLYVADPNKILIRKL